MPDFIAYNSGTTVSGALHRGNTVMAVNNTPNFQNGMIWLVNADISNQYMIIANTFWKDKTAQAGAYPMVFSTTGLTNEALRARINNLAISKTAQSFPTFNNAMDWAVAQGLFITNQDYPAIITSGCVVNLDAGLPASYPMTNTTWYDLSGNNLLGTLNNTPTFVSSGASSYLSFLTAQTENVTFSGTTGLPSGNTEVTISAWVCPQGLSGGLVTQGIVGWGNYGTNLRSASLKVGIGFAVFSLGTTSAVSNNMLTNNTWYNLVGTYDSTGTAKIYINGVLDNQVDIGAALSLSGANLTIGSVNSDYYNGWISQIQIFNRALSSTEVLANYNALSSRYITPAPTPTPTPTGGFGTITLEFFEGSGTIGNARIYKNTVSYLSRTTSGTSSGTIQVGDTYYGTITASGSDVELYVYSNVYGYRYSNTGTDSLVSGTYTRVAGENITVTAYSSAPPPDPTPSCFVEGTMISLSDGTQVPIETLYNGIDLESSLIDTLENTNNPFELYQWSSNELVETRTVSSISKFHPEVVNRTIIVNNGLLEATYNHTQLVRVNGIWRMIRMEHLAVGDFLYNSDGSLTEITNIRVNTEPRTVYKVTLSDVSHTYFANNILTHNIK